MQGGPIAATSTDKPLNDQDPPIESPKLQGAKPIPLILSVAVGLILRFLIPKPVAVTAQAWQLLSIFLSTIAGLVLAPLPVGAWAFIGLTVTVLTNTLPFAVAFNAFTSEVLWLIVISFFFARGFVKTGLGDRVATYFVKWLGKSTLGLSYGLTVAEALIAPAMPSTTARAGGVFLPIISSLSLASGSKPNDPSSKKLGAYLIQTQFQVGHLDQLLLWYQSFLANHSVKEIFWLFQRILWVILYSPNVTASFRIWTCLLEEPFYSNQQMTSHVWLISKLMVITLQARTKMHFPPTTGQACGQSSALYLTGAAQNLLCLNLAKGLGVEIANPWMAWFKAASLPALVALLTTPLLMYKLFPPEIKNTPDAPSQAEKKLQALGAVTKGEWVMVATMLMAVTLWVAG
jgi:di/tricarboxylate transporter